MEIKDFKNKRVTIMGLGLHGGGIGAAKFFTKIGAKVIVTDLKTKKELADSLKKIKKIKNIKYVLGGHKKEDFINTDFVIQGAGVPFNSPYLKIAKNHKIPIDTDVGIFFELCQKTRMDTDKNTDTHRHYPQIIGVTGTKGKSTTSALIYEFLKTKYKNVFLAGNIRASVFDILPKLNQNSIVVLELSSWQLEGIKKHKKSPHIAIITNILPDHLNRYGSMNKYIEAKKIIFKYQKPEDYIILSPNDKILKKLAGETKSKVIFSRINANLTRISQITAPANIGLATEAAKLYKIPQRLMKKVIKDFKRLEGRLEFIKTVRNVKYYNDTTATIPDAAIFGIKTMADKNNRLILIAGGEDKKIPFKSYNKLAKKIKKYVKYTILLPGSASKKLEERLSVLKYNNIKKVKNMNQAVKNADSLAKRGDTVILSPGAASFNLFKHEFDRGKKFKEAIEKIR